MRSSRTSPPMSRSLPTLLLILTWLFLGTAPGCSLRYDADELPRKSDTADVDPPDASNLDPADASGVEPADASPDPADAAPRLDAAATPGDCGDDTEMCCTTDPACGFGDEFIECNEETSICEACGRLGESCCETGPPCKGLLNCPLGLCIL